MRFLTPMNRAILEALRRRAALAIARGISLAVPFGALFVTSMLLSPMLRIILSPLDVSHKEVFSGSAAWQGNASAFLFGLFIAIGAWDVWRSKGWWAQAALSWKAPCRSLLLLLTAPLCFVVERTHMLGGANSPNGITVPRNLDSWTFPPKLKANEGSPIMRELSAIPSIIIRIPFWAGLAASTLTMLLTSVAVMPFALAEDFLSLLAQKKAAAAANGSPSLKERLNASLQKLASEAPHVLAAAEASALNETSTAKTSSKPPLRL